MFWPKELRGDWGSHLVMLRSYCWLYIQELLPMVLGRLYGMPEIKPGQPMCKASKCLATLLLLQSPKYFLIFITIDQIIYSLILYQFWNYLILFLFKGQNSLLLNMFYINTPFILILTVNILFSCILALELFFSATVSSVIHN